MDMLISGSSKRIAGTLTGAISILGTISLILGADLSHSFLIQIANPMKERKRMAFCCTFPIKTINAEAVRHPCCRRLRSNLVVPLRADRSLDVTPENRTQFQHGYPFKLTSNINTPPKYFPGPRVLPQLPPLSQIAVARMPLSALSPGEPLGFSVL